MEDEIVVKEEKIEEEMVDIDDILLKREIEDDDYDETELVELRDIEIKEFPCNTKEKPHECSICLKTFRTVKGLKLHTRVHTDGQPYSCFICGTAFKLQDALTDHVTTHMGLDKHHSEIVKLNMDESSDFDSGLKRRRELGKARSQRYRQRKREEAQKRILVSQNEQNIDKTQQNKLKRQRELARVRSRRYRYKKRLFNMKALEHAIDDSKNPGPSECKP